MRENSGTIFPTEGQITPENFHTNPGKSQDEQEERHKVHGLCGCSVPDAFAQGELIHFSHCRQEV